MIIENPKYDETNTIQDLRDNNIEGWAKHRYYVGNKYFTGVPCTYFSNKNKAMEYLNWLKELDFFIEELFFSDYGSLQYLIKRQKEWKLKYKPIVIEELRQEDMFLTN